MSYNQYLLFCSCSYFHLLLFLVATFHQNWLNSYALLMFVMFMLIQLVNGRDVYEICIKDNYNFLQIYLILFFVSPVALVWNIKESFCFYRIKKHIQENFSKENLLVNILDADGHKFFVTVDISLLKFTKKIMRYYNDGYFEKKSCYTKIVANYLEKNGLGKLHNYTTKTEILKIDSKSLFLKDKQIEKEFLEIEIKKAQMGEKL